VTFEVRKPSVSVMMPVSNAAAIRFGDLQTPFGQVVGEDRRRGNLVRFDEIQFSEILIGFVVVDIDIGLTEIFEDFPRAFEIGAIDGDESVVVALPVLSLPGFAAFQEFER
jgi:hypothetical protein